MVFLIVQISFKLLHHMKNTQEQMLAFYKPSVRSNCKYPNPLSYTLNGVNFYLNVNIVWGLYACLPELCCENGSGLPEPPSSHGNSGSER